MIHPCPYYRRYYQVATHDPAGKCMGDCVDEPICVTQEPFHGWQDSDLQQGKPV